MKSKGYKDSEKKRKNKTTWGNVEPGERTAHEGSLQAAEDNAAHDDCKHVSSTNMDPEPREGENPGSEEEGDQDWQQLDKKEQSRSDNRKGGYPKN